MKDKATSRTREDELKFLHKEAQNIAKQFKDCQSFKEDKGILKSAKESVDFYEGRQWLTIKSKLPFRKPVMNIIQNLTDDKKASILAKVFKINYAVNNNIASTKKVSKFAEYQMKEMGQKHLETKGTKDALLKGTFIWYFWWNEDKIGLNGAMEGGLEATVVDINDIAVANPLEQDEQKQEYIIIRSRESVKKVKDMCQTLREDELDKYILPTNYEPMYTKDVEKVNEENVYVYLKFFKQNGEVYFEKATEEILIQEPTCLNPLTNLRAKKEKLEKDVEETDKDVYVQEGVNRKMMTKPKANTNPMDNKYKATVYPIVIKDFIERDNCIFGLSFVEQVIPIQININQMIATTLLAATKHAMPTVVVKQGAVGLKTLDMSKAGNVVVDSSPYGVKGIDILQPGSIPSSQYELAQSLIALTKDVYRANDVLNDGRNIAQGMSAVAIQQLTAIQEKPVAQWQEALALAIEKEGKILEMFYKLFYRNKRYSYQMGDAELLANGGNMQQIGNMPNYQEDIFDGTEYLDTPFNIVVEVGEGAKYSELMLTSSLETLFLNGTVANLSPDDLMMWAELVPDYVFPKKNEFKLLIKQKQNSIINQLSAQIEQLQAQLQQADMQNEALQQEFTTRVNQYNENLKKLGIQASSLASSRNKN